MLAGHLVERAEGLVHQQQLAGCAGERGRWRRCCIPPDSCHGRCLAKSGEPDQLEHLRARALRSALCPSPWSSSGSSMFVRPCATRTSPPAGRPCRSPGRARAWWGGLPLIVIGATARLRRGWRPSRNSVLLPQPGRADERHELTGARPSRSMPRQGVDLVGVAGVEHLVDAPATPPPTVAWPPVPTGAPSSPPAGGCASASRSIRTTSAAIGEAQARRRRARR